MYWGYIRLKCKSLAAKRITKNLVYDFYVVSYDDIKIVMSGAIVIGPTR